MRAVGEERHEEPRCGVPSVTRPCTRVGLAAVKVQRGHASGRMGDKRDRGRAVELLHARHQTANLRGERRRVAGAVVIEVGGVPGGLSSDCGEVDDRGVEAGNSQVEVGVRRGTPWRSGSASSAVQMVWSLNAGPSRRRCVRLPCRRRELSTWVRICEIAAGSEGCPE